LALRYESVGLKAGGNSALDLSRSEWAPTLVLFSTVDDRSAVAMFSGCSSVRGSVERGEAEQRKRTDADLRPVLVRFEARKSRLSSPRFR
jgi:hypothetical protein